MLATNCYEEAQRMAEPRSTASRILVLYYAATAVFLVLDYFAGINVRLAFLEAHPLARAAYYGFCFACLAIMMWRPEWTTLVSAFESLVTLIALILGMAIKTMVVTDRMIETGAGIVTSQEIINFMLAGSIAYLSWVRGLNAIKREIGL